MFPIPFPSLWFKLAGILAITALVGFHFLGDSKTKKKLADAQAEVLQITEQKRITEEQLLSVTTSVQELNKRLEASNKARAEVRADLDVTLKKLRAKKPPVECKAAIDWSVQNKQDMSW